MADEHESTFSKGLANLTEDLIKLYDEVGSPSAKEVAEIRERAELLAGDAGPGRIAEEIVFFRMNCLLYQEKMLTMGELSEKLMIESYAATRMISWWVKRGFVELSGNPNDRRIVRVALTEKGRQFHKIIGDVIMRRVQRIIGRLSPDEQLTLLRLLFDVREMGQSEDIT